MGTYSALFYGSNVESCVLAFRFLSVTTLRDSLVLPYNFSSPQILKKTSLLGEAHFLRVSLFPRGKARPSKALRCRADTGGARWVVSHLSWFSGSPGRSECIVKNDLGSLVFLLFPSDVGMTVVLRSLPITNLGPCAHTLPTEPPLDLAPSVVDLSGSQYSWGLNSDAELCPILHGAYLR